MEASSGAVRSPAQFEPNGSRRRAYATVGVYTIYHAGSPNHRRDFRLDVTNLTNARYLATDATNLDGGWSRLAHERAITVGFEQGF